MPLIVPLGKSGRIIVPGLAHRIQLAAEHRRRAAPVNHAHGRQRLPPTIHTLSAHYESTTTLRAQQRAHAALPVRAHLANQGRVLFTELDNLDHLRLFSASSAQTSYGLHSPAGVQMICR